MFCTHCGEQIEDNTRYCPYCGGEIPEKFRTEETDRKQDPAIAEPVTAVSVQGSPALSRTAKPRKKTGLIPAVLLIAVAAAAGIWFFLSRSSRPAQQPESQAQAGASAQPVSDDDEWTVEYLTSEIQFDEFERWVYDYDEYGNRTKLASYKASPDTVITEDTELFSITESIYKENQRLKQIYTGFKDGTPVTTVITTYSYDSDGFLISEESTETADGKEPETDIITYENDAQGNNLIQRSGATVYHNTFDSDGNRIQQDVVSEQDGSETPIVRWVWEYDTEGHVLRFAQYSYDNSTNDYSDLVKESQFELNEYGDTTIETTRNYKHPEESGVTTYAHKYDENGNHISQIRKNMDGTTDTFKYKPYRIRETKDK